MTSDTIFQSITVRSAWLTSCWRAGEAVGNVRNNHPPLIDAVG
jgi:hypothetical protein